MTAQARLLGGRYQVGELLGYGGMAEVHKGRDLRLGRDVAIKMLRTDLARDATFQERFRREAQNSAALNHPAIVAVYDTGEEISAAGEKQPFIVMEFVNGRTLKEVLAAEQRLQPRRALEVIADICAALEFSHRHGIIHRDIKPGNVMVTLNGQVKVMDFGIARALASGATTMTQTSAVIGTAQYLSPEQARGESVDARSDVYAAGCVLFELLCGHPPFVGDSPVSVAYQHVREDPKAPSDINHDVPPDVDAIVLKALAKNPLNRYQSAQEMRADALRAVSGRPVLATPVMSEAETMAMAGPPRQMGNNTAATRAIPAGVGGRPEPRGTSSWVVAVLAALFVLAVVSLVVGLALRNSGDKEPDKPVTAAMPSLLDRSENDAKTLIEQAKLTSVTPGQDRSADCDKGTVTKQNPAAGTVIELNSPVTYQVCVGPELVRVPGDLVGNTAQSVQTRLEGLKLRVDLVPVDSTATKDQVTKVEKQGEEVPEGTLIKVNVSRGNLSGVPNVVDQARDVAIGILENAGFEVKVVDGEPSPTPGIVTSQNPKSGAKAKNGDTITITVSTELVTPPTGTTSPPPPDGDPGTGGGNGNGGGIGDILG
jgi:beta-lactam-binding protein with PASTA domain/predicted Ser/Thr protein kinase